MNETAIRVSLMNETAIRDNSMNETAIEENPMNETAVRESPMNETATNQPTSSEVLLGSEPYTNFHRGLAASIGATIEKMLTRQSLGELTEQHHLSRLVDTLRRKLNYFLPGDGEQRWAELVASSRPSSVSLRRTASQRRTPRTVDLGDGIEEIFGLDEGPHKSTQECLRRARRFRKWLQSEFTPRERLIIDRNRGTVVLDGTEYVDIKPDALKLLHFMASNAGEVMNGRLIYREVMGISMEHENYFGRLMDDLCDELRALIRSKPGFGYWFELPSILVARPKRRKRALD